MIHRYVFHNERLATIEEVRLSPGQAGLLSGWGIFTTVRIFEGIPFAFERHWKRLERDANRIRCPFSFKAERVREQLGEVLRANHVKEGCARIYAIYNQAGFWRSGEEFPPADLIIYSSDLPAYSQYARLGVREQGRHAASPLAGVKVTSWLTNVWSLQEAQREGFDEVVMLNERGQVAECTAANIFCVKGGRVATPPLNSGCLEGVTRGVLLEIGAAAGVPVEEKPLVPQDLYAADEVFISSTNRNLLPVSEIAGRKIGDGNTPVMERLEKVFESYVRKYLDSQAASVAKR
ncbi:MAG: aminotransferase class IV [Candidatus Acidiferrales bacterium]